MFVSVALERGVTVLQINLPAIAADIVDSAREVLAEPFGL